MSICEGMRISNHVILKSLGAGGQATVWLAEDLMLNRKVAAKLISVPLGSENDTSNWERMRREAKIISKIKDENVVFIYQGVEDIIEIEGNRFGVLGYFMEYLSNGDFNNIEIVKRVSSNTDALVDVVQRMALALEAVHKHDIIHYDIKPANFLVKVDEKNKIYPLLSDFGASNHSMDASGLLRTDQWNSPERFNGQALVGDSAKLSDYYSLGLVIYYLSTAKFPYADITVSRLNAKNDYEFWKEIHCNKDLDWSNFSPEREVFKKIVQRLTQKNPQERRRGLDLCIKFLARFRSEITSVSIDLSDIKIPPAPVSKYVWSPALHHYFGHKRYMYILRSKSFLKNFNHITSENRKKILGGAGVYAILGPNDLIITFWAADTDKHIVESILKIDNIKIESILFHTNEIYISGSKKEHEIDGVDTTNIKNFINKLKEDLIDDNINIINTREKIIDENPDFWIRKISQNNEEFMAFILFRWINPLEEANVDYYHGKLKSTCSKFSTSFITGFSYDFKTFVIQIRLSDYNKVGSLLLELHAFLTGKKSLEGYREFTSETYLDLLQDQRWVSEDGFLYDKIFEGLD